MTMNATFVFISTSSHRRSCRRTFSISFISIFFASFLYKKCIILIALFLYFFFYFAVYSRSIKRSYWFLFLFYRIYFYHNKLWELQIYWSKKSSICWNIFTKMIDIFPNTLIKTQQMHINLNRN